MPSARQNIDDTAETSCGAVRGSCEGDVLVFRGIEYGQVSARFRRPSPPAPWRGIRDARMFGAACPHERSSAHLAIPNAAMEPGAVTGEGCLHLNVWTPSLQGERPVLVWLHGGGLMEGSACQPWYDGARLAARGNVVVVTLNYRLGILGWLYLRQLSRGALLTDANVGMHDQLAALRWVSSNIESFGGDPTNVTVAGQSAGSRSVAALLTSPLALGLFDKAIALSGEACSHTEAEAAALAEHFLEVSGFGSPSTLIDLPVETLVKAGNEFFARAAEMWPSGVPRRLAHVLDAESLPEDPIAAIRAGRGASVPALFGSTREETALMIAGDPNLDDAEDSEYVSRLVREFGETRAMAFIAAYRADLEARLPYVTARDVFVLIDSERSYSMPTRELASAHSDAGGETYVSLFIAPSPNRALGACHTIDLSYIFGTFDIPGIDSFSGAGPDAQRLSHFIQDAWATFMWTGQPTAATSPVKWPRYDTNRHPTMLLRWPPSAQDDPLGEARTVWKANA